MEEPLISSQLAIARGIACKCPRCGQGNLFTGLLKPLQRCNACGLDYSFFDVGDGGAVLAIMLVGFLITGMALYAQLVWHWAVWMHIVVWPIVTFVLSIMILRPLKGCLITLQYAHKAGLGQREDDDE